MRDSIERPEALDTGTIMMTGLDAADMVAAVRLADRGPSPRGQAGWCHEDYTITNTSDRVIRFILSTARRHHDWAGIRR